MAETPYVEKSELEVLIVSDTHTAGVHLNIRAGPTFAVLV